MTITMESSPDLGGRMSDERVARVSVASRGIGHEITRQLAQRIPTASLLRDRKTIPW